MIRRLMLGTLLAVALVGWGATAARADGEGWMELVSATPISYEGTPAWEYYYDVYSGGLGSASQIWMHGFDANELLNPLQIITHSRLPFSNSCLSPLPLKL